MNAHKNILFLTNRLPFPPDKGDKIRTFHQIEHLALWHRVHCACFVDTPRDAARVEDLRRGCAQVIAIPWKPSSALARAAAGWLAGRPLTEAAFAHRAMSQALARLARQVRFDAVVAFSSMMARPALAVPARRHVLDLCDADSRKWFDYARASRLPLAIACRTEARRLRAWERACADRFDATILITDRERSVLDPAGRHPRLHVVPNGVALGGDALPPAAACGPVVGFFGSMDYRPNIEGIGWFAERVWPRVRAELPAAELLIVGRRPARRVRRLAAMPGVTVTGEVADVRDSLRRCRMGVVPLRIARGLQNKVLEAMAARRPVVCTSAVAAGLRARPGRDLLVADAADHFAMKVVDLCRFDALCRHVAEAGHRCVAAHYCWPEATRAYERVVLGEAPADAQELPQRGPVRGRQRPGPAPSHAAACARAEAACV